MTVHVDPSTVQETRKDRGYKVKLDPEVRALVEAFVAKQNAKSALARVSLTRVVNEATRQYVALFDVPTAPDEEAA